MTHRTTMLRRIVALLCATLAFGAPVRAQQQLVGIAPAGDPNEVVSNFFMAEMPLVDVLQQLELLTGRSVIRTQALPPATITFNNGMQRQQFTRAELVIAIESLLSINGIGLTPLGDKFIKVVPLQQVQQEAPELVVGSLKDVPASGKIVSKLFRLQYLDPQQFQLQLNPFLSLKNVATFQNSNTVIVTDTISNLQRVEMLLVEIDKRLNIETKFYQIQYASAADLAQSIRSTIDSAKSGSAGGRVVVQQGGAPGAPTPTGAPSAAGTMQQIVLSTNTAINADERTNQLIVITDPANIPFFDDMIAKLDVPADPPTAIEVIPMRYADAEELAGLLSQFTTSRTSAASRTSTGSRPGARTISSPFPGQPTVQPQTPLSGQQQRQQVVQDAMQGALEGGQTQFSQLLTIQPDLRTNSLVVSGTIEDLRLIRKVIDQLDVLLAQVRIEVVIAEITLSGGLQRGIDVFRLSYSDAGSDATGTGAGARPALPAGGLYGSGVLGPIAGTISGIINNGRLEDATIDAILSAGRTDSRVNILSQPTISTMHNKEAKLIVGQSQPIVTGTTQSSISDNVTSNFQYQDIATQLTVTPKVGPNNVIEMEIEQQIDDIAAGGGTDVNGTEQPTISRRQASSTVAVKDGQMIVLGGLQKNSMTKTKSHMFILGDIPLLNTLFTRTVEDNVKTELVVFIKPKVIRTTDEADADARNLINQVHVNEENARQLEKITGMPHTPPEEEVEEKSDHPKPKRPANR